MKPKTFVLYHANCADGFGAAFAAWAALGDEAVYIPVQHGEPMPEIPDGAVVYVVDFSYSREELLQLDERVMHLKVIDHHASAAERLEGLPFVIFCAEKSGAVLAWEYFHDDLPVPELLLYVQDRDLWRWRLPESREVSAALALQPFDFEVWAELEVGALRQDGRVAVKVVKSAAERQARKADWQEVAGVRVPVVNATCFISETCEEMMHLWPDAPFVASYFVKGNGDVVWSLRCGPEGDVRAVAESLGGGGHRQAAGFTVKAEMPGGAL